MRKNKILYLIFAIIFVLPSIFVLAGCFGSGIVSPKLPNIDNATDLIEYTPSQGENQYEEDDDLYTSKYLNFITEINGSYKTDRPFEIDTANANLRIYDNIYFYEYDFFQMMSSDYRYIWCSLSDENDLQYAEVEREQGEDIQTNIKKSGIYKVVFDTSTFLFDLVYKSEITTPVYEEIKNCDIYTVETKWITMQKSGDEFFIEDFHIEKAKIVAFDSSFSHTSHYKTTIDESCLNKYINKSGKKPTSYIWFMIGGTYNIYLNAKTYVVRVELVEADADGYSAAVYENNQLTNLELLNNDINYIFKYQLTVKTERYGNYDVVVATLPKIYNSAYIEFNLAPTNESMSLLRESSGKYYFKNAGDYTITINLVEFTISVSLA